MNDEIKDYGFGIIQQNMQFYQQGWVYVLNAVV